MYLTKKKLIIYSTIVVLISSLVSYSLSYYLYDKYSKKEAEKTNLIIPVSHIVYINDFKINVQNGMTQNIDYIGSTINEAIQWSVNELQDGGKIFIKSGIYTITEEITVENVHNIIIEGEGASTVFRVGENANTKVFSMSDISNWVLKNFKIDGNKNNQNGDIDTFHTVYCHNVSNTIFDNLIILNSYAESIRMDSDCKRNTILNCYISGGVDTGIALVGVGTDENIVMNNWLGNFEEDNCIRLRYGASYNKIIGNTLFNKDGISLYNVNRNYVQQGNIILSNVIDCNEDEGIRTRQGIYLSGDSIINTIIEANYIINARRGIYVQSSDNLINNNIIKNCYYGIELSSGKNTISNNNIELCEADGININEGDYNTIQGNNIKNNDRNGVRISSSYNSIINNVIVSDSIHKLQDRAISLLSNSSNNICANNVIHGSQYVPIILDEGLNNMLYQNIGYDSEV